MTHLQDVLSICPAMPGQAVRASDGVLIEDGAIIALPTEAWQVQALVRLAAHQDLCVVPRGMGSARAGGAVAIYDGGKRPVVVDLTINRDIQVDVLRHTISVGCGATNEDVQEAASACGLFYPIDAYRYSTMGGNIATDAYGVESLAYGTTKDYVLGLDLILPDGERLTTRSSVTPMGIDLTRLLVGSEGTLGIIWSATLRLLDMPERTYTYIAGFDTHDATFRTVDLLLRQYRSALTSLDFMDALTTDAIGSEYLAEHRGRYVLLARSRYESMPGFTRVDDRDAAFVWDTYYNLMYVDAVRVCVDTTDAELLNHYVEQLAAEHNCEVRVNGSAGLGIFHVSFSSDDSKSIAECNARTRSHVMSILGGSLAVEGIGNMGNDLFVSTQTDAARLNLKIKQALDPLGIMNPKKVL